MSDWRNSEIHGRMKTAYLEHIDILRAVVEYPSLDPITRCEYCANPAIGWYIRLDKEHDRVVLSGRCGNCTVFDDIEIDVTEHPHLPILLTMLS